MISLWPVRGGPVAKDGKVWFAAGVWPMEGVFVHCLDANTGKSIWINDRCSFIYGTQPHNAKATGGLAPQGYLLLDGDDLIVPSSVAFPARFDAATGKLKEFELPSQGRLPRRLVCLDCIGKREAAFTKEGFALRQRGQRTPPRG